MLVRRHAGGTNTSPIYVKPGIGKVLEHALPFAPDAVLVFGARHRVSLFLDTPLKGSDLARSRCGREFDDE